MSPDRGPEPELEGPLRRGRAPARLGGPGDGGAALDDQVRPSQEASRIEQPAQGAARGGERQVGDDPKRSSGKLDAEEVALDDGDGVDVVEAVVETPQGTPVELDGDDAGAGGDERCREGAVAGAEVHDELARSDAG